MNWIAALALLVSLAAQADPLPTLEDYRKLLLGMRREGTYTLHWPGQKPARISYKLDWNTERLKSNAPAFQGPSESKLRLWTDRLWTKDGSTLTVENEDRPLPIDCVFVQGQDNSAPWRNTLQPRYILKVYIVANDPECIGPLNTNPNVYTSNPQLWDTYLYYEIRDITVMLPIEPKLRLFRNEANLLLETP